jgi:hypothetical protein
MIDKDAVFRCAWQMVRAHGDEAVEIARTTAERLGLDGDRNGQELWQAVAGTVEQMIGSSREVAKGSSR